MCALRCQLTVRIEGGPGTSTRPTSSNPLCSSCALSTSSHPIPLIQLFQQLPPHTCVVCGHQKVLGRLFTRARMSVRQKVGLYHIELPGECMSLCVYVCVTYVSLGVSSSWQPHTASSTQPHRTTHGERARTRGRRPLLLPTFAPTECIGCITHMQNASTIASHTNTINTRTLAKKTSAIHNKQAQRTTN